MDSAPVISEDQTHKKLTRAYYTALMPINPQRLSYPQKNEDQRERAKGFRRTDSPQRLRREFSVMICFGLKDGSL